MAHFRPRILSQLIKKSLGWSPIVGVLGARQCGKTTLLKQFCNETLTFDHPKTESLFETAGEQLLESAKKPLFLDEVQKYPPIFDLLKYSVDERRRPGQFLITGSVRFASKKNIQESLTGRAIVWELLPLTLEETHSKPLSSFWEEFRPKSVEKLFQRLEKRDEFSESHLKTYLKQGGMPGICFLRDSSQREAAFSSLVETIIERDFYFVRASKVRAALLLELLADLAVSQGDPISFSVLAKKYRVSLPTIKVIIRTFEDLFLIRWHGKTCFFEDLGIRNHLVESRGLHLTRPIESLVFSQLKAARAYLKEEAIRIHPYQTRGGAYVPFVLETKSHGTIAIAIDEEPVLSEKSVKSLYSFVKQSPTATLLHFHSGKNSTLHKGKIISLPITKLF